MSIFRESFPDFIQQELTRRQDGMASRNPTFLHQLNSRTAWVRMTSGVNYEGSSALAKKYVMQGGVLNGDALRSGLGGNGTSSYDLLSPGGKTNRLGIRPMPGITNVSIQSKGAYGSLQEATVTFTAWDIRQLEELELLYMRPGYTVLLEFGWNYAKANGVFPKYDILDKSDITLNDAFAEIYQMIASSNGNYDALLGYVKNYNWSARDDGGYDCTTSIISLGEVLESLKCNWVPIETKAFNNSGKGLLQIPNNSTKNVIESYEKGIIPGLIQELWNHMSDKPGSGKLNQQASVVSDSGTGNFYYLYKQKVGTAKNDRNGLPKHLGTDSQEEIFITLGSFCDLLNTYVLPKGKTNQPLSEIVTYETTYDSSNYVIYQKENTTNSKESLFNPAKPSNAFAKTLKCIASPLSLSTNLGICFVANDNWDNLQIPADETSFSASVNIPKDISIAVENKALGYGAGTRPEAAFKRFAPNITKTEVRPPVSILNPIDIIQAIIPDKYYSYKSKLGLTNDINTLAKDLGNAITSVDFPSNDNLYPRFSFYNGSSFTSSTPLSNTQTVNLLDYFGSAESIYTELFIYNYDPTPPGKLNLKTGGITGAVEDPFRESKSSVRDSSGTSWSKADVIKAIEKAFTNVPLNDIVQRSLQNQTPEVANQISKLASTVSSKNALSFIAPSTKNSKQLGYISNIYVNLNFLYDQAISKNNASNDTQNKNTISVRDYLQSILREVQNSLGNINSFDIQVDNRNSIGRIIDVNFTGEPENNKSPFLLQIHNLTSVVRDYKFSSKIFPEMGSIIAISAQDATGIGKLGYDNATLVAWNRGIEDRLIPKKNFNNDIQISKSENVTSFILPFLTKMYAYFQAIKGDDKDNANFAYGGLDFAFRDFLSNLDRFDPRNEFKTIIPTELSITLDGLGGIIIGNIFKINQDIVPRGYRSTGGRDMAYIVTKLGHKISDNDWVTELNAFPIVFENSKAVNVQDKWKNNQYPGTITLVTNRGNVIISALGTRAFNQSNLKIAINFFEDRGYKDYQIAALVGGFLQESGLQPNTTNSIGAIGIAQWLGARKKSLITRKNYNTLETQLEFVYSELNNSEKAAGAKLKTSSDLESAIAAAAAYERFGGITQGAATTYEDVVDAIEAGARIGYAKDLLERIKVGEFK
jgi:hypothetical protein